MRPYSLKVSSTDHLSIHNRRTHKRRDPPNVRNPSAQTHRGVAGPKPAMVFEDRETPAQWRVEWFDDDGACELAIFNGPDAHQQALRYAVQKCGILRKCS